MRSGELVKILRGRAVIPAVRSAPDFAAAMATAAPLVALLHGSILSLPGLLAQAESAGKILLIHLDLIEGVGKDRSGVNYLVQIGAKAVISTKQYLLRAARDEGLLCIQRIFLMDSDSLRTGVDLLRSFRPDALEILPGTVPRRAFEQLAAVGVPILAGGLISTPQDIARALENGALAVSTSRRDLWDVRPAAAGA